MDLSARNLKLSFLNILLEIIVFIDFLEELPGKLVRSLTLAIITAFFLGIFLGVVLNETKSGKFHNLFVYLFIPDTRISEFEIPARYPKKISDQEFPTISARSVLVVDRKNHSYLYEKEAGSRLPPASTTKLMTALVALESGIGLTSVIEVPEECTRIETQKAGFLPKEKVTYQDLIYTLLVGSAGDAACALANGSGISYEEFIRRMNIKAGQYSLKNTYFTNPIGLDDPAGGHLSTANDLYSLTENVLTNSYLQQIVQTKDYSVTNGESSRKILNTNNMLWDVPGTVGVKTGRTEAAGEVLIYEYKKDNADLVIIVMGSEDRFSDTKKILEWSLHSYDFGP